MYRHIVQSKEWADIKNEYGRPSVSVGEIYYTKHKIPFTKKYMGYCPRVDPFRIDFEKLKISLKENRCVGVTFDVPNIFINSPEEKRAEELFKKHCKKSKRSEFAKANVILDLKKSERDLFEGMSKKHRYNTRYASRNGVTVKLAESQEDFDTFFELYKSTSLRQSFFIRPRKYYQIIWDQLHPKNMCHILTAYYQDKPLASWMVFLYENVLYYPYGGSSTENREIFSSNALGWEVIRFGKNNNCELFDMWGAADDPTDTTDSYYGFTEFKLKFGGEHVKYIDSYDFVINKPMHAIFTSINNFRWKLLEMGLIK